MIENGPLVMERVLIRDNRSRGVGAGLAVFDSDEVRIADSVIRDNFNTQAVVGFPPCSPSDTSGGATGLGGGVFLRSVRSAEIVRSAIIGNMGSRWRGHQRARGRRAHDTQ